MADHPMVSIDRTVVETNTFYVSIAESATSTAAFRDALLEGGVHINPPLPGSRWVRFVTHLGIDREAIDTTIRIVRRTLASMEAIRTRGDAP
jgi:threonine aldolase